MAPQAAWKRKISLLRRTGQISRAVEELSQFLDTYYSDVDGWLELADVYASCSRYARPHFTISDSYHSHLHCFSYSSSLQSLQHALLLAPQNPSYVLLAGETAFTLSDSALALKYFLLAVELSDASDPLDANVNGVADSVPEGVTVRAWYGVKSVSRYLFCYGRCTNLFLRHSVRADFFRRLPLPHHLAYPGRKPKPKHLFHHQVTSSSSTNWRPNDF